MKKYQTLKLFFLANIFGFVRFFMSHVLPPQSVKAKSRRNHREWAGLALPSRFSEQQEAAEGKSHSLSCKVHNFRKMCQSRTDDKRGSWGRCCSKPRSLMPNTDRRLLHAGLLLEATTVQSARHFLTESTCRDAAVATLSLLHHARVEPQTG